MVRKQNHVYQIQSNEKVILNVKVLNYPLPFSINAC